MLIKTDDSYSETGVVSEYEDKGLAVLEKKIFSAYLTKQGARILDIGCFVGRVSFPLSQAGNSVFGIDISPIAIHRAEELRKERKKDNVYFGIASAIKIPFRDNTFDYVLFPYNTIETITSTGQRIEAIQEACRTVKDNGLVLFSVLNRFYPRNLIRVLISELRALMYRLLLLIRADTLFPRRINKDGRQPIRKDFGSIMWVEPGGTQPIQVHFSTPYGIRKLLRTSSLKLIKKIPVMNHGPQRTDADVLEHKYFRLIQTPVFYYVCKKTGESDR